MFAKAPKAQLSNFTGGIFCAGAALAALEWFKPLWTLVKEQRMTITLRPAASGGVIDGKAAIQDASLTALVDAARTGAGWVALYALSATLLAVGIAALVVGYASFILAAGREATVSRRWSLAITASGLVAVISVLAGSWMFAWVESHLVQDLGLARSGYDAFVQSPFIPVIAASVLILVGLQASRTRELEDETAGLV